MAFGLSDPLTWGIVFLGALVLEVVVVMNLRAHRPAGRQAGYQASSQAPTLADGEALTDVLSRFVFDAAGEKVGETVAMDGDKVIIKHGATFSAVPRRSLSEGDEGFNLAADVDLDAARAAGADWKARQHKEITYSADELPEDERPGAAS